MTRRMMTKRVLRSSGITFAGTHYNSRELAHLCRTASGQRVCVLYDPNDIRQIWVIDPQADRHLEVPMQGYLIRTPLPLVQHHARRQQNTMPVLHHTFQLKRAIPLPIRDTRVPPAQSPTARSPLPAAPRERTVPPVIVVVQVAPEAGSLAALLRSVIEQFMRD